MQTIALTNIAIQVAVILLARQYVQSATQRRLLYSISGAALLATGAGLLATGGIDTSALGRVGVWIIYIAFGAGVVAAIVHTLRRGNTTRFAWRRGRYAQYRSYRRI